MKKLFYLPILLLVVMTSIAQPTNYTPGEQVCWQYNGRPHGYFKAAGNGERHILISFTGDGENNCNNYDSQAPQKFLGAEWDGRTVRAPGDTIVWEVLTILHTSSFWIPEYAADIDYFFNNIDPINTSETWRFHIEGLSGGVGRLWGYLTNLFGHNSPYRNIFSTTISQSTTEFGTEGFYEMVQEYSVGRRHWVWHGTNDQNPHTPPKWSDTLYSYLNGTKHLTMQAGGGHGADTWDSCMSLAGTDTTTNRWLWMVTQGSDTTEPEPEPDTCMDEGGGPDGYEPGAFVCWTFNGREHGYFRAACGGQRQVLVVFTGNDEDSCNDLAGKAPQNLFDAMGIDWDGKTVRSPGDTVKWEILIMPDHSDYYLPNYASDMDYFFEHIADLDFEDPRKFHIAGIAGGVGRMWGYLVNDQNHNSSYRNIFGTTLSLAAPWLGSTIQTGIQTYSAGRRHWVWYGAATTNGFYPAGASQQLYDILNGAKKITAQAGSGHDAVTWDSCFSIMGTDTSTNRWLWMVIDPAGPPYRVNTGNNPPEKEADIITTTILYPNPATNKVVINMKALAPSSYNITVTDALGRVQKVVRNVRQPNYNLDISALQKGVYIIQVEAGKQKIQKKLVKE